MVERGLAVLVLRHVFACNNGYIHHPATACVPIQRRLLGTMPDTAIMHGQIARIHVKADLAAVRVIVNEIFFAE